MYGAIGAIGTECARFFANKGIKKVSSFSLSFVYLIGKLFKNVNDLGALLALVGRNREKFELLLEKIKESGVDLEPLLIIADVCFDAERIITETIEKYGRLDILINNAGFAIAGTLETLKMDDYDSMMATNVRSIVELTQLAIPYLTETKGNVVNVSSAAGLMAVPSLFAYSMSKATVDHFTKCMYFQFEHNFQVKSMHMNNYNSNTICAYEYWNII